MMVGVVFLSATVLSIVKPNLATWLLFSLVFFVTTFILLVNDEVWIMMINCLTWLIRTVTLMHGGDL